ncbi:MAG: YHS domain-containing protein [Candidatus Omnitrophica bacterium]|nr:YHS domain-containing protein [Candidatus Omnitrophota bacterium]
MFKKILLILLVCISIFAINKFSFALMCGKHSEHQQKAQTHSEYSATETNKETIPEGVVNVGNQICPVSGEKINEKLKATYEYEGKIYNFCCSMCIEEFKKDPGKYIKKIEEELKNSSVNTGTDESAADTKTQASPGIHQGHKH